MAVNGNTSTSDLPSWQQLLETIKPSPPSVDALYQQGLANIVDYWQQGRITSEQAMGLIEMLVVAKLEYDAGEMVANALSPKKKSAPSAAPRRRTTPV